MAVDTPDQAAKRKAAVTAKSKKQGPKKGRKRAAGSKESKKMQWHQLAAARERRKEDQTQEQRKKANQISWMWKIWLSARPMLMSLLIQFMEHTKREATFGWQSKKNMIYSFLKSIKNKRLSWSICQREIWTL
jgi:hypothetical protein